MEEENLKDKIDKLSEKMDEVIEKDKKKSKGFKLPSKAKLSKTKVKKNWVTIVKINENKAVDFSREPIEDETVMIDGVPRLATGEAVLNYKGKPLMIVPSWRVTPFSPTQDFKESLEDGSNTKGYALLLARMKKGILEPVKKKIPIGIILVVVAIIGIIAYVVLKK